MKYGERLGAIAEQASKRERRAVDAERETQALKKAEYMLAHLGEEFEGVVNGVTNFGMFVELPNTIEGLVRMQSMDDYYEFDEKQLLLIGRRTNRQFRIGDTVQVKVENVNMEERTIDFTVVGMPKRDVPTRRTPTTIKATGYRPKKDDSRRKPEKRDERGRPAKRGKRNDAKPGDTRGKRADSKPGDKRGASAQGRSTLKLKKSDKSGGGTKRGAKKRHR